MKIVSTLAAAAVALAAAATASPLSPPKLIGTVGPGFTISLKKNGRLVKSLKAGRYTLVVVDRSSIHNFVLEGPGGVEKRVTTVAFRGTKTVTVVLKRGKWEFYCAPHEPSMHGDFRVT